MRDELLGTPIGSATGGAADHRTEVTSSLMAALAYEHKPAPNATQNLPVRYLTLRACLIPDAMLRIR